MHENTHSQLLAGATDQEKPVKWSAVFSIVSVKEEGAPSMSSKRNAATTPGGSHILSMLLFCLGLYSMALGEAVQRVLPFWPGIAQTDAFYYPFVALVFVFLASLLILASLLALRVNVLLVSGVFLLSLLPLGISLLPFRKTGFPTTISLWTTNWFLIYGGVVVALSLILLVRVKGVWPVLWRTVLLTAAGAAIAIAILLGRGPADWKPSTPLPIFSLLSLLVGGGLIFTVIFWLTSTGRKPGQTG